MQFFESTIISIYPLYVLREKQKELQYVKEYKPAVEDVKHLRVLMFGHVGAGKSSFINSVSNVLRGRMSIPALTSSTTSDRRRGTSKTFFPLVFNDVMGLEDGNNSGIHASDITLAMKGHVKDGHKFNPIAPLTKEDYGYNPSPSLDDKVHVLVCVMSANAPQINASVLQKMKKVRETASELGIPQMAMMTHIDAACGEIEKDLKNVYRSKHLHKKMKDFSAAVGIPMNCIFPVKNYSDEIDLKDDVDFLVLSALRKMVDFGDDFVEKNLN
uniref:Interferon-induced protein 44-like n=1 Tax=Poecilia latipinna TaxID=48699 RepID=A0A3B3UNY0_9TELE